MNSSQNILLIGGTRSIGPHVVRKLVGLGHSVTVYHRGRHNAPLPTEVRQVLHPKAARPVRHFPPELFTPQPDVIIHMIPMGEEDSESALNAFRGRTQRVVWISSGDVYRAYGVFTRTEPGAIEQGLLAEDSPLRTALYAYRAQAKSSEDIEYNYEKILVEKTALSDPEMRSVILRLPKVYGPGDNANLVTVYAFRNHPQWRWTHGHVENVAEAIVLAALHPGASTIYNVGEEETPTIAERLAILPPPDSPVDADAAYNFDQDIAYDTTRIRHELGFCETTPENEAMRHTVEAARKFNAR